MVNSLIPLFTRFAAGCAENNFLGLVPWYHYLPASSFDGSCNVTSFTVLGAGSGFLLILLAVVDDLLRIAGLVAVVFVLMAGVKYIMSQGSPDGVSRAQSSLLNALIGLAVALVAIQFVSFLGNRIGGNAVGSANSTGIDIGSLPNPGGVGSGAIIARILQIVFAVVGSLAFLFLVLGGFNYVSSQGDAQKAAKAKGTIVYALVGLVVAILAQSIVSFVAGRL
ncbi:MAG TPA: pilin [Candidatus Saccharimonadales bacterium]|nr:pilin [Candidatus Saccharimonadales bacterium]